jgi:A/G-specific adenine glycosylase
VKAEAARAALADWFARARRDLPWRRDRTPYRVWLSEIMLQQTTVAAVVPYYERFLARFPDVRALASAELDDVLALWSGLGYYRRARHLHAAAGRIVEHHGGEFPRDVESLRSLPGIGPYTAGAVASLAFDVKAPVVDGNVERVLSRLVDLDVDPRRGAGRKRILAAAEELLPERGAGAHNEALIELGALVCMPGAAALCGDCPLARACLARARGTVHERPVKPPRPRPRARADLALAIARDGRVLVGRRRDDEVWGGLWELPRTSLVDGESREDSARRIGRELLGVAAALAGEGPIATARHTVMNERISLEVWPARLRGEPRARGYAELAFVDERAWGELALPSPQRRVAPSVVRWLAGSPAPD